jgi:hypothetical protein
MFADTENSPGFRVTQHALNIGIRETDERFQHPGTGSAPSVLRRFAAPCPNQKLTRRVEVDRPWDSPHCRANALRLIVGKEDFRWVKGRHISVI